MTSSCHLTKGGLIIRLGLQHAPQIRMWRLLTDVVPILHHIPSVPPMKQRHQNAPWMTQGVIYDNEKKTMSTLTIKMIMVITTAAYQSSRETTLQMRSQLVDYTSDPRSNNENSKVQETYNWCSNATDTPKGKRCDQWVIH